MSCCEETTNLTKVTAAALQWTVQEAPLVAAAYHAGAVLLDCCKQYGPLPTELHQAQLRALTRSRALARALSASPPLNPSPNPSPSPSTNPRYLVAHGHGEARVEHAYDHRLALVRARARVS